MIKRIQKQISSLLRPSAPRLILLLALFTAACQPTPRQLAATAQTQATPTTAPQPLVIAAPPGTVVTSTPLSTGPDTQPVSITTGPNPSLTVWINETSPEHRQTLNQMMADFSQASQIDVELVLVAPDLLPKLMETAVISDAYDLPDIVLHPIEYTMGWAERGILDTAVTNVAIDEIGRDTFNPDALALITQNGAAAAIPSDGYQQMIVYRADWAGEMGLAPPDHYDAMLTMAQTISNTEALISGFVIPTESNLTTTHQVFEQIAAANGCQLIDDKGEVLILQPACQEALDFYYTIVHNYSPSGVQTDTSSRNAYLSGRTGLIISSPAILPMLAGLDSAAEPACAECETDPGYLAQNSGILTEIVGSSPSALPASLGEMMVLGITNEAERETAVAFAKYWFNEGYPTWLAVESERKVPLRWGTATQPHQFINAWGTHSLVPDGPSLRDIFGDVLITQLRDSVAISNRWGIEQGQGALVTTLYEELTFPIVLQEMLSGYFNPSQTLVETHNRIIDLIPNYPYNAEE